MPDQPVRKVPEKPSWGRQRRKAVDNMDLDPLSLIGSYYHILDDEQI